jgi:hypothetical protein
MFARAARIEEVLDVTAGAATAAVDFCKPRGSTGGVPGGVYDSSTKVENIRLRKQKTSRNSG